MRLRHLRLRVTTNTGLFGTDIPLSDGLVVIRAENSMGKSTCLKAILVCLGMEAILTANRGDLPLPPVLKEYVDTDEGRARVIASSVSVEVENRNGERIVVHRTIKGDPDSGLIEVLKGPALSSPGEYLSEQYFVGRAGDSTREMGFLRFLATFIGWTLPEVRTYQGDERPLYIQCIFPYFFVEQQRGWSTLEPPLPTRFGIRELHKRVVEFLLALDANDIAMKRLQLLAAQLAVTQSWTAVTSEVLAIARGVGGIMQRLPTAPQAAWTNAHAPLFLVPVGDDWIAAESMRTSLRTRLAELVDQEIPRVSQIVSSAQDRLSTTQLRLNERQSVLSRMRGVLAVDIGELRATEERLSKLNEDLQRNKDARTLLSLGGSSLKHLAQQQCPTCHQHVVDSLTPLAEGQAVMNIDDNIRFIEEQRRTFSAVLVNQQGVVEARELQLAAVLEEVVTLRGDIRSLKETLVSDGRTPSIAAVRERIQLEEKAERLDQAEEMIAEKLSDLLGLAARWTGLQAEKASLPSADTSDEDKRKIARWGELIREQLDQYDFQSLALNEIDIDPQSYRPQHEGFDLPTNISASDFIRVIWSYLNGLRELATEFPTNHPGLLVFDEPRQQSAKDLSFAQLLERVANAGHSGHQIIFATSEREATLLPMLDGVDHTYHPFVGHMIARVYE